MRISGWVLVAAVTISAGLTLAHHFPQVPAASGSDANFTRSESPAGAQPSHKTSLDFWREAEARKSARYRQDGSTAIGNQPTLPVTEERLAYERELFSRMRTDHLAVSAPANATDEKADAKSESRVTPVQHLASRTVQKHRIRKTWVARAPYPPNSYAHNAYAEYERSMRPSFFFW